MSTFAVFGMTRYYASQAALKNTPTTMIERGSNVLGGGAVRALSEAEWLIAVEAHADRIFESKRCVQLSEPFDTPHFASDFIGLLKKHGECRDLTIKYKRKDEPRKGSKKAFSLKWSEWKN